MVKKRSSLNQRVGQCKTMNPGGGWPIGVTFWYQLDQACRVDASQVVRLLAL